MHKCEIKNHDSDIRPSVHVCAVVYQGFHCAPSPPHSLAPAHNVLHGHTLCSSPVGHIILQMCALEVDKLQLCEVVQICQWLGNLHDTLLEEQEFFQPKFKYLNAAECAHVKGHAFSEVEMIRICPDLESCMKTSLYFSKSNLLSKSWAFA